MGAKNIEVKIGNHHTGSKPLIVKLPLIKLSFSWSKDYHGTTVYEIDTHANCKILIITIAGLLASLLAALSSLAIHLISANTSFALQMILIINLVMNAKFFVLSAIPREFPPSDSFPDGWKTDGKMILDLIKPSK